MAVSPPDASPPVPGADSPFTIVAPPPTGTLQPSYADLPYFAPLSSPPLLPNAALHSTDRPPTPLFGPTPISQQQGLLLPYYDARSPYSIEQADARTRWRFLGALLWAIVILSVLVVVCIMSGKFLRDGLGQVRRWVPFVNVLHSISLTSCNSTSISLLSTCSYNELSYMHKVCSLTTFGSTWHTLQNFKCHYHYSRFASCYIFFVSLSFHPLEQVFVP